MKYKNYDAQEIPAFLTYFRENDVDIFFVLKNLERKISHCLLLDRQFFVVIVDLFKFCMSCDNELSSELNYSNYWWSHVINISLLNILISSCSISKHVIDVRLANYTKLDKNSPIDLFSKTNVRGVGTIIFGMGNSAQSAWTALRTG